MKSVLVKMAIIFNGIRVSPLWLLSKFFLSQQEIQAWDEDVRRCNMSFFRLMYYHPEYKEVLYVRGGVLFKIWKPFCGGFPLYINSEITYMGGV